jgi:hypothetical protein
LQLNPNLRNRFVIASEEVIDSFNSFPVAAPVVVGEPVHVDLLAFNSFPVAAETLAPCLFINLSSANFEVREISLACLPTHAAFRRKPFPIPGGKREFGGKGTGFNGEGGWENFRS